MANEGIEAVIKELHDLTETIQSGGLIDEGRIKALMLDNIEQLVDARIEKQQADAPQRRIPNALIGPDGNQINKSNRFYPYLKDFSEGRAHGVTGGLKIKAVDLWLAYQGKMLDHLSSPDRFAAPSDDLKAAIKAMTADSAGAGLEWVPEELSGDLWLDFYQASRVLPTLMEAPVIGGKLLIPMGLGEIQFRRGRSGNPTNPQDPNTNRVESDVTELIAEVIYDYTLDEEAIVAMMPTIRAEMTRAGGEAMDAFTLNADSTQAATGNINSDDAAPAADAYYVSAGQDGIRHQWLVDNTTQGVDAGGDALTDNDLTSAFGKLGKYYDPSKLSIVTDVATYVGGFLKTGTGAPGEYVSTVDKIGSDAIISTGQIGMYRGAPLIVSASHPLTASDGKANASNGNTLGSISIYHRDMWKYGFQRKLLIEADRDIRNRLHIAVASFRQAVASRGTRSSAKHTAGIKNVLV